MDNNFPYLRYVLLFMPWVLSLLFIDYPILSYLLAWAGSFFIFYLSLSGRIKTLPVDRPFAAQLMRPIIIVQLIFAGYMCCTSIFYFIEIMNEDNVLGLAAKCQRYYCLGHAAFTTGMLIFMPKFLIPKYTCSDISPGKLAFNISLCCIPLSWFLGVFEGLSQFSHQLSTLSFIAGTLALALGFSERKTLRTCCCLIIYGLNVYHAFISGFKEPVILSVLLPGLFLYPAYPKMVRYSLGPLLLTLFILLPTYNRIFREQAWSAEIPASQAAQLAFSATLNPEHAESNWSFLTYRFSEISMFSKYVQSTPAHTGHYGFDLIQQSLLSAIPRVLWPSKPATEMLVMERVHQAEVVHPDSKVSAKPAFIADAYLSGGAAGIFICLFSYGAMCQLISNKAEELFGGYLPGIALIFTGLFQIFWRGQCFEFLFNSVCWSYASMYMIFWILRFTHILRKNEDFTD